MLPNYGSLSSVGPCIRVRGTCTYPSFPQWLGKHSSGKKSDRLCRELKQKMGDKILSNRFAIQNEVVPIVLEIILSMMQDKKVEELIQFMDDVSITNEMIKEHLLGLSLKADFQKQFDKIDAKCKAAFSREYNKQHKDFTKVTGKADKADKEDDKDKKTKGGKGAAADDENDGGAALDSNHEEEEDEEDELMGEEEVKELRAQKKKEAERRKQEAAQKRLRAMTSLTMIQTESTAAPKGKKK